MRSFGRLAGSIVALLAGACIAPPVAAAGLSGAQRVAAVQPATESLPVADRVLVLKG